MFADLPRDDCRLTEKRKGEIISFFPGLARPTPFSGPQLGQRPLARADRSFVQAPKPLSSRRDRSTAHPPPPLARRGRATPRLRSKLTASGPPSLLSCHCSSPFPTCVSSTNVIRSTRRR